MQCHSCTPYLPFCQWGAAACPVNSGSHRHPPGGGATASTAPFCCLTGRGHCRPQPADAQSRGVAANCCLLSKRRNLSEAVLFFPNQKPFEVVPFVVSGVKQRSSGCLREAGWSAVMRDRWLTASHPCVFHRTSALFSEAGEAEKLRFLLCRQKNGGDIGNVSQGAP